jgi:ribosome biogenesis SPOUT family RNA methylase Rps3
MHGIVIENTLGGMVWHLLEYKQTCKWCGNCTITSNVLNTGTCYLDIGEHVDLDYVCDEFEFNADLDRC